MKVNFFSNIYSILIIYLVDSLRILKAVRQWWAPTRRYKFTKPTRLNSGTYFLILILKTSTDSEDFMFSEINSRFLKLDATV